MFSVLVLWFLASFIFLTFGKMVIRIFSASTESGGYGICDTFFLGLCATGTLLAFLSVWIPVNGVVMWGMLIVSALYQLYFYRYKDENIFGEVYNRIIKLPAWGKAAMAVVFIVILLYSLFPPLIIDTWLYHMQSIIWNETYPVIPGIANLHGRFGFNSNILLFSSAFSLKDLFGFRLYNLLGLLMLVFSWWVIARMAFSKSFWVKVSFAVLGFSFLLLYREYLSSASSDPLPNILVAYLLFKAVTDKDAICRFPLLYWILPVFCLTLKLSVAPVCLLSLVLLVGLLRQKKYTAVTLYLLLALLIVVPWCTRNVYITGYLVYPYPSIDLFDVDWKVPASLAEVEKSAVSSWAKMPGMTPDQFEQLPPMGWIKSWTVRNLKQYPFCMFIFCLAVISPVIMLVLRRRKTLTGFGQALPWITALAGTVFWFMMAPDFRFSFAFIAATALIPIAMLHIDTNKKWLKAGVYCLFIFGIVYIPVKDRALFINILGHVQPASLLYAPKELESSDIRYRSRGIVRYEEDMFKQYVSKEKGNIVLYRPKVSQLCYEEAFPCINCPFETVEPRGERIEDGFRSTQP